MRGRGEDPPRRLLSLSAKWTQGPIIGKLERAIGNSTALSVDRESQKTSVLSILYDQSPSLRGFSVGLLEDNKSGPDNQIKEVGQTELVIKVLLQVTKGVLNKL